MFLIHVDYYQKNRQYTYSHLPIQICLIHTSFHSHNLQHILRHQVMFPLLIHAICHSFIGLYELHHLNEYRFQSHLHYLKANPLHKYHHQHGLNDHTPRLYYFWISLRIGTHFPISIYQYHVYYLDYFTHPHKLR